MTPADVLARLRALEAQATPAPWAVLRLAYGVTVAGPDGVSLVDDDGLFDVDHDAELAAAARNTLPLLLDVAKCANDLIRHGTQSSEYLFDLAAALHRLEHTAP